MGLEVHQTKSDIDTGTSSGDGGSGALCSTRLDFESNEFPATASTTNGFFPQDDVTEKQHCPFRDANGTEVIGARQPEYPQGMPYGINGFSLKVLHRRCQVVSPVTGMFIGANSALHKLR